MPVTARSTVELDQPNPIDGGKVIVFPTSLEQQKEQFTAALTTHHRDLLVYARSIVFDSDQARDIVQEASLVAWNKFSHYDPSRADFGAWMRGILRNKIRDWVKSKKGGSRPEIAMEDAHLDFLEDHFSNAHQPTFSKLKSCLKRLPDELLSPIELTYYQGQKGDEASEELGIQPATLRKRLSRARKALHQCLTLSKEQ